MHLERESMSYFSVFMSYFVVWILWPVLQIYSQGVWFLINPKVSFMNPGDKPILTLKISVTNFCRFRYFADFDFKIVLLDQNSFEPIALC